jgi:hypothetical protein
VFSNRSGILLRGSKLRVLRHYTTRFSAAISPSQLITGFQLVNIGGRQSDLDLGGTPE